MTFNPYEILQIPETATSAEIHAQYRKLCKTLHPDAGGGEEEFKTLNEAYELLMNEQRRQEYDEAGTSDEIGRRAVQGLQQLFILCLSKTDSSRVDQTDFMQEMHNEISRQKALCKQALDQLNHQKKAQDDSLKKITKRLKAKKGNFLLAALKKTMDEILLPIANHEQQIVVFEQMLGMLGDYEYEFEEVSAPSSPQMMFGGLSPYSKLVAQQGLGGNYGYPS